MTNSNLCVADAASAPEVADARDFREPPPQIGGQWLDAPFYVGETPAERVIGRGAEAELSRDVAFPVLEAAGVRVHLVAVGIDPRRGLQIEKGRLEPVEDGAPHIEESGPVRPAQIPPSGRGQQFAADRGGVDWHPAGGLAGAEQVDDAGETAVHHNRPNAQIRAGRALLGWSQEQLADEAEIALSTVRDTENERRAADTTAVKNIRRALWNGGVVFVPGRQDEGPGIRLVANRPNLIRRPTTMQKYEGMPFAVEWQGRVVTVFVAYEVIDDLDRHRGPTPDEAYLKTFDRHRGKILDAVTLAITDPENFDRLGRLYIRQKDLDMLKQGQWYRVSIATGDDIGAASVAGMMNKCVATFINSGLPSDVQVFHDLNITGAHVYYFSPRAAAITKDLLASHKAAPCLKQPDLSTMRKVKF